MNRFGIDTGPLVAFLNARDSFHRWAKETLSTVKPPLYTCESVISEACFLVRNINGGPEAVLSLVSRGVISVDFRLGQDVGKVRKLMAKYANVPMSLADACLVQMTEAEHEMTIITLDEDFRIYRRQGRQVVPVIMP
jgi:predicted nucleic acid-binding protein